MKTFLAIFLYLISINSIVLAQDWSENAELPGNEKCFTSHGKEVCFKDGNRKNIFNLTQQELNKSVEQGAKYALNYPVEISELQLPVMAMEKFFNSDSRSPLRRFIFKITKKLSPFKNFDDLFNWIGLHEYPQTMNEIGPNIIPAMGDLEQYPMGVSIFNHHGSPSMTFSCAACHSQNLFGTKVLGLTNRFPRANEVFILGKKALSASNPLLFQMMVGPSKEDMNIYKQSRNAIKYVKLKQPLALGLDTSLAQVGLSLSIRKKDAYATRVPLRRAQRASSRSHKLNHVPADSKPAVWWNLKYKTKWLSDGAIDSGNPVHTNFLWNEIGRGVNLRKLETWLDVNKQVVKNLTSYVFNAEAPKFNDFFPGEINLSSAMRGEKVYLKNCKGCHGIYEKGWNLPNSNKLSYEQKIKTTKVWYHKKSIVKDVGTDKYRYEGMKYFYKDLNRLQISKSIGTVVKPKIGYIPPPLVGIWARWPYFHNNSIPTLSQVISPVSERSKTYIAVPSEDRYQDFDLKNNGYPAKEYIREPYKTDPEFLFDTRKLGMQNIGHEKMLFDDQGKYKFTQQQKEDLIVFLQTL